VAVALAVGKSRQAAPALVEAGVALVRLVHHRQAEPTTLVVMVATQIYRVRLKAIH